jgi:hypothetical protein
MSRIARASLSNRKKSAAPTRGNGRRTDLKAIERRNDWTLLERLKAENLELRNRAIQLALRIQLLRRVGRSEPSSAGDAFATASREARGVGVSATPWRRRPNRAP